MYGYICEHCGAHLDPGRSIAIVVTNNLVKVNINEKDNKT